jgi:hypothetical protein
VGNFAPGFKGFTGNNNTSGPNGVLTTEDQLWVGDAPSQVWVLDPVMGTPLTQPIITGSTQNRADEMCYDPKDRIVAAVNNADNPPFITFISTTDFTVLGNIVFDGTNGAPKATNGAEQCQWNPRNGLIYLTIPEVNGNGTNSFPGAVVTIDPQVRPFAVKQTFMLPLSACTGPQGLTIGPLQAVGQTFQGQIGLGCNNGFINGQPAANNAIIDDSGNVIQTFPGGGGCDQVWFNPGNRIFFNACRTAPNPPTPSLFIVSEPRMGGPSFQVQTQFTGSGSNAHSVAVDSFTNVAYVPASSASTSGLCSLKGAVDADGCILLFAQRPTATHDFNGDGISDILWRDTSSNLAAWLMNGNVPGTILQAGGYGAAPGWSVVGQRDFNGDGKYDLLWRDSSGNTAIWLLNGLQVLQTGGIGNVGIIWSVVGTADLVGGGGVVERPDGKGDILWLDNTGNAAMWLMDGFHISVAEPLGNVGVTWSVQGTADFFGLGTGDILWRDTLGNLAIWQINFPGPVNAGGLGNVPLVWSVAGTGDFNGDGKWDILWRDSSGNLAIWLMDGFSILQAGGIGNPGSTWNVAVTGDYDGDGMSDILFRDSSTGAAMIFFMNGLTITSRTSLGTVPLVWTIQGVNAD